MVDQKEALEDEITANTVTETFVTRGIEELPDGGYGWVVVFASFLINVHTWGINASFGIFLAYFLEHNVFPGATYLGYAFVDGLSFAMAMFISPVATMVVGTFGMHACLYTGVVFESTALIGASFAREYWQFLLSQGLCFGFGMGFLYVGSAGVVSQWFTKRRSFANGIVASGGAGFGGLVYNLAVNAMIEHLSVAWAFRILGIVAGVVNLASSVLMRDRNAHIGASQLPFDIKLFKRPEFLLLQAYGFFNQLGYIVLLYSLPHYANSVGLPAQQGSTIGTMLCLGIFLGRNLVGYVCDKLGPINTTGFVAFLTGVFVLCIWPFAKTYGVLIFFALLVGLTAATYFATIPPVCAAVVGLRELNAALSVTFVCIVLPLIFSEPIGLQIVAHTGSYLGTQLFTGFMYIATAVCLWCLKAWKVGDLKKRNEFNIEKGSSELSGNFDTAEPRRSSFLRRLLIWKAV